MAHKEKIMVDARSQQEYCDAVERNNTHQNNFSMKIHTYSTNLFNWYNTQIYDFSCSVSYIQK